MKDYRFSRAPPTSFRRLESEKRSPEMVTSGLSSFGLILAGLAVAFMVWALWNFYNAVRRP
jgi:hypothetical protein